MSVEVSVGGCVLHRVRESGLLTYLLFSCITKQAKADSFKCRHSYGAYCIATLIVILISMSIYIVHRCIN